MAGISKSLKQRLITEGGLDSDTLELAMEQCANTDSKIIDHLSAEGFIAASKLANIISSEYAIPLYDVSSHNLELSPPDLIDHKLLKKHRVLPLYRRGNRLFIALGDPANHQAITDIRFQTGLSIEAVIAETDKLDAAIENFFKAQEEDLNDSLGDDNSELNDLDLSLIHI